MLCSNLSTVFQCQTRLFPSCVLLLWLPWRNPLSKWWNCQAQRTVIRPICFLCLSSGKKVYALVPVPVLAALQGWDDVGGTRVLPDTKLLISILNHEMMNINSHHAFLCPLLKWIRQPAIPVEWACRCPWAKQVGVVGGLIGMCGHYVRVVTIRQQTWSREA